MFRSLLAFIPLLLVVTDAAVPGPESTLPERASRSSEFIYHHLDVLGTSLDLVVIAASKATADAAEKAVLDEVERLRQVLSSYDPASELARLNAALPGTSRKVSSELLDVLRQYDLWQERTQGAYSGRLGSLIATWRGAQQDNQLPSDATLAKIVAELATPAWEISLAQQTVRRLDARQINVDSLGKGYIIGKAVAAARQQAPAIEGILLNLGGDVRVWGSASIESRLPWRIGVQDPSRPEDNAAPLTTLALDDKAVASSGGYQRFYVVGGRKYSHILDPRTGKPVSTARSATVIADDNAVANALATALCVLSPAEGIELVESVPGAECLIVTANARPLRSKGFQQFELPLPQAATTKSGEFGDGAMPCFLSSTSVWPDGYQVTIDLSITGRRKRPYLYAWITDSAGKHVKTIAAWGDERKYIRKMSAWTGAVGNDSASLIKTISRATRKAGDYSLVWDGTDQSGKQVARGTYSVWLETAVEDGPHAAQSAKINCQGETATAKINKAASLGDTVISYGPKKET